MLITDDITIAAATSSSTKNFNAQMSNIHHDRRHHDVEQFCIIIGSGIGGLCQASASIKLKSKQHSQFQIHNFTILEEKNPHVENGEITHTILLVAAAYDAPSSLSSLLV